MGAFKNVLDKIVKHEKNGGNSYVTIINFEQNQRIIYERVKPSAVEMQKISYSGGGTSFNPVFDKVAEITDKTINREKIVFVFMTDGYANYPENEVGKLQTIMKAHPNNFIYTGI